MPLEDRDIFAAVFARYGDQPIELVMEQYEKAKRLNVEMEKRLVASDVFASHPADPPDAADSQDAEEPARKRRITRRSLKVRPEEAITADFVVCCLCGEERKVLTSRHLASHGVTVEEYRRLCGYDPEVKLMGKRYAKKMVESARAMQRRRSRGGKEDG